MRTTAFAAAALLSLTIAAFARAQAPGGASPAAGESIVLAPSPSNPGCEVAKLVSAGGPAPNDARTLAIRWVGYSNFELAYGGRILLLDAFYDRGRIYPPLGVAAADIRKADAILIGHGHFDHMADAAPIAAATGAVIVGAPLTTDKLLAQSVDPAHVRTVTGRGGEVLQFGPFKVEPILARHGEPPPSVTAAFAGALRSVTQPLTPEEASEQAAIRRRGVADPRVITEGTLAYLITLDTGFRIMYRDSGGSVTAQEQAAMAKVGHVDVALVAVAADYLTTLTSARALEHLRTYKPRVYIPAHHDAPLNELWRPTEPIFEALKQEDPGLITISREYREPVCFNTRPVPSSAR